MALAPTRPPDLDLPTLPTPAPRRWRAASDDALVRAAARGNDGAIGAIHDRYRAPLERYCRTILLHRDDAEDAAQAALAAALRALSEGRARPHALRAWLYKIAHREALAVLRRRPPAPAGDEALELVSDPREERTTSRRRLAELLDDLRALPERQRSALVLHEVAGLSFAEVGETLSVTPGAARQAAHEARTELRARRDELQALFPAGPALALAAGGAGALAGGAAATGGAGALGAAGAWLAGAGMATKCAAVCAAIGAIGAVTIPAERELRRPAASTSADAASAEARTAAARAGDATAPGPNVIAHPREGVTTEPRAAGAPGRSARAGRPAARRTRPGRAGRKVAAPTPSRAAAPPAPDVTDVSVEESPVGGRVPETSAPAAATPVAPAASSPPAVEATPVESSSVGSGGVTGRPSDDVVSVQVE